MAEGINNSSQAYQLKTIRYQDTSINILLQNENGPCPLLAAANALLLRGVITLDPVCVRNSVASTDDVVNMLANRALLTAGNRTAGEIANTADTPASNAETSNSNISSSSAPHEYHLNEVLSILPNLQHGMDVNPKFTAGPTGVEYTNNLAAFDLLGVELVHGWLLDPQDLETASVMVESKTYNEMVEVVIAGNVARDTVQRLERQLCEKEKRLDAMGDQSETKDDACAGTAGQNSERRILSAPTDIGEEDQISNDNQEQCCGIINESFNENPPTNPEFNEENISSQPKKSLAQDEDIALRKEISDTRQTICELSLQITRSEVANAFLASSSHQLTYHGLEQLHNHMANGAVCVFFRNNHFATLTKNAGVLYLLVADLGYANTPEIVWEKLDNIDGDTEYNNEFFARPTPRADMTVASGGSSIPGIAPELLLARRSQAELDYQLALSMSNGAPGGGVQSEHVSEQLARQLQELEYARQGQQRPAAANQRTRQLVNTPAAAASSNCTVS